MLRKASKKEEDLRMSSEENLAKKIAKEQRTGQLKALDQVGCLDFYVMIKIRMGLDRI